MYLHIYKSTDFWICEKGSYLHAWSKGCLYISTGWSLVKGSSLNKIFAYIGSSPVVKGIMSPDEYFHKVYKIKSVLSLHAEMVY